MAQERITVEVDLDTRGFQQSMQELIRTTEQGFDSLGESIRRAIDARNNINDISSIIQSFSDLSMNASSAASMVAAVGTIMKKGGLATAATGVGLAVAGIGVALNVAAFGMSAFSRDSRDFKENTVDAFNESTRAAEEFRRSLENSKIAWQNRINAIEHQSRANATLLSELIFLNNQQEKTEDVMERIHVIISLLNKSLPELGLSWDSIGNSINKSSYELEEFLELMSAQDILEESQRQFFEMFSRREEAIRKFKEQMALIGINVHDDDADLYAYLIGNNIMVGERFEGARKYAEQILNVREAMGELNREMIENQRTVKEHSDAIAKATANQERVLKAVANVWQITLNDIETSLQSLADLQAEHAQAEQELANNKEELLNRMQRAYDDYVSYANNAFAKLGDPLNISLAEMIDNLEYNQEAMKKWSDGIAVLANATENQIDAGFLEKLRNMGPASAMIVEQLVADMQTGGSKIDEINALLVQGVDDANAQITKGYDFSGFIGDVEQTWRDLANVIEENTSLIESLELQKAEAQEVVLSMMSEPYFLDTLGSFADKVGVEIPAGIARGIANNSFAAVNQVVALMQQVIAAAQSAADIRSPSRLFRDKIGRNIARGIGVGIEDEMPSVSEKLEKQIKLCLATVQRNVQPNFYPLTSSNMNRQTATADAVLASSDRTNKLLASIAEYGAQQTTPNVNVTLEPTHDIRGFFEYISAGVKQADYLSGADSSI